MLAVTAILSCVIKIRGIFKSTKWRHFQNVKFEALSARRGDKSTGNAQDKAIVDAYRNKFIIPLDFEMLDSAAPYYQAGLRKKTML